MKTTEELLFGRDEDLRVTGVKTEEATKYGNFMPSPLVLAQYILATGHAPKERVEKVALIEVTAQNGAGEKFWRTYRFADAERGARFADVMKSYEENENSIHMTIFNRSNRLPWYLPHIV